MTRVFTADQLEHFAKLVRRAWTLNGAGGAFYSSATAVLPDDLDAALLRPWLDQWGVPFPEAPVEDPRYRGLAQISDC